MKPSRFLTATAVLALLGSTSMAQVQKLDVSRCNILLDGVFTPALIVDINGQRRSFTIGKNGLTRNVIFDANAAQRFIANQFDTSAFQLSYSSCGDSAESAGAPPLPAAPAPAPVVVVAPPPPPPPPPEDGDGDGCSCGPCYEL